MHLFIVLFLIGYAGWTVSAHICVLLGLNLKTLIFLAPLMVTVLLGIYYFLLKTTKQVLHTPIFDVKETRNDNNKIYLFSLTALTILPIALYYSWIAFWILSVLILTLSLFRRDEADILVFHHNATANIYHKLKKTDSLILVLLTLAAIGLSYTVSRSDLDDALYVAIASFSSSHPNQILMSNDPMLGEPDFPLILSNYRFTTFELLSGAIAYLLSTPAMNVYYVYILPIWVIATVAATFLLTKEIFPRHWLMAGFITLMLMLLLGEMHRSPANFSFVRIFQGKAVFLSVIMPTIFYITTRYFSERGTKGDLLLLACCQISSIGMSSFGMLMGPIVGFGALMANIPSVLKVDRMRIYYNIATLLIPLPYLISVALQINGTAAMKYSVEDASDVWIRVFGTHQQYLVGFLILAGPVLAKDVLTRWRITIPTLLFFAIYLNPWLDGFISKYVTSPPVYWRVTWSFPILIFVAISLCMIVNNLFVENKGSRLISIVLSIIVLSMTLNSYPFHTLRSDNIDAYEGFATWKIPKNHLVVAQKAIATEPNGGRLLAPDEIAGVISRFEERPRLIITRGMYLEFYRSLIGDSKIASRQLLYDFVMGRGSLQAEKVGVAIRLLDVSVIVFRSGTETNDVLQLLELERFKKQESIHGYSIWVRHL